jgi:hypothetical protein
MYNKLIALVNSQNNIISYSHFKKKFKITYGKVIKYGGKTDYCTDCFEFRQSLRFASS